VVVSLIGVNLSAQKAGFKGAASPFGGCGVSPLFISFAPAAGWRGEKRYVGTPQTPAGEDPCTPTGQGDAFKSMPMGVSALPCCMALMIEVL